FRTWITYVIFSRSPRSQPSFPTRRSSDLIEDTFPVIAWELKNEEKKINALTARKAIGKYRGKTWEVWYTPEIPYSFGPWKLNGRSEEHTSELQSRENLVCRLLLEKKKNII